VAQVQEGAVALVGGAAAAEVHRVALLVHHHVAAGQGPEEGEARVAVAVAHVAVVPDRDGAVLDVEEPDVSQRRMRSCWASMSMPPSAPQPVAHHAVLGPEDLLGVAGEGARKGA
jgi:hypothetical protein